MLIHDRFVFLHVPKTGGTFLRRILQQELPECRPLPDMPRSAHFGWDKIPPEAAGLPVLAFVRNPWDWYVSWYSFAVGQPRVSFEQMRSTQPLFRKLFDDDSTAEPKSDAANGANDFATTIKRACTGIVDIDDAAELEQLVQGFDLAKPLMEGHDFYTARLMVTVGAGFESDRATIGRFESLTDDLESFLEKAQVDLPEGAMDRIRAAEKHGESRHRPYREYYDEELSDLVEDSCKALIERFGYSFQ
jgi:hypothetical protein